METAELSIEEMEVQELLKEVIDPELELNIIDLGLVYTIQVSSKTKNILIHLTLTSPGCPLGDVIMQDIEQTLNRQFIGYNVIVQLVWSPIWTMDMVSDEGKLFLGEL